MKKRESFWSWRCCLFGQGQIRYFLLLDITLRYGSEAKNQIRIREELLLKKHTCWGHSSKTILYTYSFRLGFPKYDFLLQDNRISKEFDSQIGSLKIEKFWRKRILFRNWASSIMTSHSFQCEWSNFLFGTLVNCSGSCLDGLGL